MHRSTIIQRAINRITRRFGIVPFAAATDRPFEHGSAERQPVFERIYEENYWGSPESGSGRGSELTRTSRYRKALLSFIDRYQVQSMFDAPCGDLNWMSTVINERPINYIGGDISQAAIAVAKDREPSLDLRVFDICADPFPDVDVWHCRDALFHLSFDDVWLALANASRADIKYALLTTHRPVIMRNVDVETGGWRYLDLHRAPLNIPPAEEYLTDYLPGELHRDVGVWRMEVIRNLVARRAEGRALSDRMASNA